MAEHFTALKSSRKYKKDLLTCRTSLYSGNSSLSEINNSKLSLGSSTLRSQKLVSTSLEKLSFISEKDNTEYENYEVDYATYLLRKLQNRVLMEGMQSKEENVKKCFVSLKFELEELLEKHVNLQQKMAYLSLYFGVINECNKKIKLGKFLKYLKENEVDILFECLSDKLDSHINQLYLIGISRKDIENLFDKKKFGEGSELDICLKKINDFIDPHKKKIFDSGAEVLKIQELLKVNSELKERYHNIIASLTNNILDVHYDRITNIINTAFERRKSFLKNGKCDNNGEIFTIKEILDAAGKSDTEKPVNSLRLSIQDSLCNAKPNSSSTPKPNIN